MESSKAPNADGDFSKSPIFNFNDDKLKFDANVVSNANENYGSVSGFLPKYLDVSAKGIPNRIPFVLLTRSRTYPTTKHPANLING